MKAQLDKAIDQYVAPLARQYGFVLVNEEAYGMGSLKDYEAGNLFIRILNDKGIVSLEIAPSSYRGKRYDLGLYKEYLDPPKLGVLNLSLQQQAEFLDSHWEWLNDALSPSKSMTTLIDIENAARQRSEKMIGPCFSKDLTLRDPHKS
ncbi:MAG: hypothetical protein OER43_05860 [Gammaproteobacteria bacterium]|nr:hypothetical protein [Gammaproteobacteria bacterium]MDH3414084.1 hypothetical protein [Gammaproteobacteria bacterium]